MSSNALVSGLVLSIITLVPLGMKWELEKKIIIPSAFLIGIVSWVVVEGLSFFVDLKLYQIFLIQIIVISGTSISLLLWRFFRDPERIPPDNANVILSPADGTIIYVKKIENGEIPFSEKSGRKFTLTDFVQHDFLPAGGYLIGIAMNFLDVHINRAPIGGRIILLKHIKGLFISLKKKEAVIQNERVFMVIENQLITVGIVQIASRLVRKIVPYIEKGKDVKIGQRIGVIKFGSQVDIVIPDFPKIQMMVKNGIKVKAGTTIIANIQNS